MVAKGRICLWCASGTDAEAAANESESRFQRAMGRLIKARDS